MKSEMLESEVLDMSLASPGILAALAGIGLILWSLRLFRNRRNGDKSVSVNSARAFFVIGVILVMIFLSTVVLLRCVNTEPTQDVFVDTGTTVKYHEEQFDGKERTVFEYQGVTYVALIPEFIEEDIGVNIEEKDLNEKDAVVNITSSSIGPISRYIYGRSERWTVFKIQSDCGVELLSDGELCYCDQKKLKQAERWYEDIGNYSYYLPPEDNQFADLEDCRLIELDVKKLRQLIALDTDKRKPLSNYKEHDIDCLSSDGVCGGYVRLASKGDQWYRFCADDDDEYDDTTYIKIPNDLAEYFRSKL